MKTPNNYPMCNRFNCEIVDQFPPGCPFGRHDPVAVTVVAMTSLAIGDVNATGGAEHAAAALHVIQNACEPCSTRLQRGPWLQHIRRLRREALQQ